MQVYSLTEARNNLKHLFESVYNDNEEVVIHRKGRESVVVVSLDQFNSMKETEYLLGTPANRERLLRSLEHARSGQTKSKELIEDESALD